MKISLESSLPGGKEAPICSEVIFSEFHGGCGWVGNKRHRAVPCDSTAFFFISPRRVYCWNVFREGVVRVTSVWHR